MSQAAASPQPPSEIDLRDQRGMLGGPGSETSTSGDRTEEEKKQDAELANRLSALIEDANSRVVPLTKMIRKVHGSPRVYVVLVANAGKSLPVAYRKHGC